MAYRVEWKNDMLFEGTTPNGHKVLMDTIKEHGGNDSAAAPMQLVLIALGGCTGMDVIAILRKMKDLPKSFYMEIDSERAPEHPKVYKKTRIKYVFVGDVKEENVKRAIELSQTKYCSVSAILRGVGEVEYSYEIKKE
jgi:putative redox protein